MFLQGDLKSGFSANSFCLYAYTVYAAVQLLYRDGVYVRRSEPLIGQMFAERHKGVPLLRLWPLEWTDATSPLQPLAELWQPALVTVQQSSICFRGLEAIRRGPGRRWAAQKWLCDVMDAQLARARRDPDPTRRHPVVL